MAKKKKKVTRVWTKAQKDKLRATIAKNKRAKKKAFKYVPVNAVEPEVRNNDPFFDLFAPATPVKVTDIPKAQAIIAELKTIEQALGQFSSFAGAPTLYFNLDAATSPNYGGQVYPTSSYSCPVDSKVLTTILSGRKKELLAQLAELNFSL